MVTRTGPALGTVRKRYAMFKCLKTNCKAYERGQLQESAQIRGALSWS